MFNLASMDPATIPATMQFFFGVIRPISYLAVLPLFIMAVIDENAKLLQNDHPNYSALIFKTAAILLGLFLYKSIFMAIVALCQNISFMVFSMDDWERMQAIIDNFTVSGSLLSIAPDKVILLAAKYLSTIVEEVFLVIRYAILALLYMLGPLAFVLALYKRTGNVLSGWFKNVLQVAFWLISLRILQSVFAGLGTLSIITQEQLPASQYLIFTVTYFVLVVSVPAITSQIFVGGLLGPIASVAVGATSAFVTSLHKELMPRLDNRLTAAAATSAWGRKIGLDKVVGAPSLNRISNDARKSDTQRSQPMKAPTAPKRDIVSVMPGVENGNMPRPAPRQKE